MDARKLEFTQPACSWPATASAPLSESRSESRIWSLPWLTEGPAPAVRLILLCVFPWMAASFQGLVEGKFPRSNPEELDLVLVQTWRTVPRPGAEWPCPPSFLLSFLTFPPHPASGLCSHPQVSVLSPSFDSRPPQAFLAAFLEPEDAVVGEMWLAGLAVTSGSLCFFVP